MKTIIGAAIGSCVHVGGLHHFLKLAETEGYHTISYGPAVSVKRIVKIIREEKPDIMAISYRLTPESASGLFLELKAEISKGGPSDVIMIFGGTPPVARVARESGLFEYAFDGTESAEYIKRYLRGDAGKSAESTLPDNLVDRVKNKYPNPLIRHHFGRPSLQETVEGVVKIAESGVLDIQSIGPDQNAQEHFFHPEDMDNSQDGQVVFRYVL
jgi:methylmalonyl-CoA mutase cobalamin-binding subunit